MLTRYYMSSRTGTLLVGFPVMIYEVEPERGDLYAVKMGKHTYLVQLLESLRDNHAYNWGCDGVIWYRRDNTTLVYAISFTTDGALTRCRYFAQEACAD